MEPLTHVLELAADALESCGVPSADYLVVHSVDPRDLGGDVEEGEFDDWPPRGKRKLKLEELASCQKEPRDGMLTYNHSLAGLTLPSGRRLYLSWGDANELAAVGVARPQAPSQIDLHFIKRYGPGPVDIPFTVAGDFLFQVDVLLSQATPGSFIREALENAEADWMSEDMLEEGEERRTALEEALDEAHDRQEIDEDELERRREHLYSAPPWFLTLSDKQLDKVAALPSARADRDPPLDNVLSAWRRPTTEMFDDLDDPANLQHVAAAWIAGKFR